jgi:hypothetical protein
MPACRRNVTLTARRSALSNQGQNLERERGHKARKLRSEGILGTHDLNSKSTIVAISSRVMSPRASAGADSSPNGVLIDHSRKVRLTSTGRKTRYSWNCAYAYLCRHSWVADLDSQRTERVLAGSPDDARLRRPKSPVRSFSRLATNHPGTQTRSAEARPKGIHIPNWPLMPQFRRHTPTPTPASPMARPAPEIWLCHFLKQKKTNNLLASFVQNAHPARRPPVHNSAQLCTLPPKPLGAAIE